MIHIDQEFPVLAGVVIRELDHTGIVHRYVRSQVTIETEVDEFYFKGMVVTFITYLERVVLAFERKSL